MDAPPNAGLSRFIWETRYRDPAAFPPELGIGDTWSRVAGAVAAAEPDPPAWKPRFLDLLRDYRFLPGGRILAGAGTSREVTLFNCFVMGAIEDSVDGIFEALKEGALTLQQGGGIGYDFSTLRPAGMPASATGTIASGPVSFMHVWDAMCATMLSTGARRGAMMATLRCDHPDIQLFIAAKRAPGALRHFNLSVLVTDDFVRAVKQDAAWPLVFQAQEDAAPRVHRQVPARALWEQICACAHDCAEPGLLFIDRINELNNLGHREHLSATNPCGEEPLPPYGACNLGSINLAAFVSAPFTPAARLDEAAIRATAAGAVRFLDDVIDVSAFPLPRQREQALRSRRIGLGITGLADALAMLGLRYDSEAGRQVAAGTMRCIRDAAYEASVALAAEKGAFPDFDRDACLQRPFLRALPESLRERIRRSALRNSHLTAIAPAGTISLLAHGVSSGLEPAFGVDTLRSVRAPDGSACRFETTSYAAALWRAHHGAATPLPDFFVDGPRIAAADHLRMQAALQSFVDGAISKTISLPQHTGVDEVSGLFLQAFELGLKGCTIYRAGSRPSVIQERCCAT